MKFGNQNLFLLLQLSGKYIVTDFRTIFNKKVRKGGEIMYKKFVALLDKTNKTAYRVSKDTGITKSTFTDWKTGRSKPKIDKLILLAKYFGVPVEYFLNDEQDKGG